MPSTAPDTGGRRDIDPACLYPYLVGEKVSFGVVGSESLRRTATTGDQLLFRNQHHDIIAIFISTIIRVVVGKKEGIVLAHSTCLYKIEEINITIARQQQ